MKLSIFDNTRQTRTVIGDTSDYPIPRAGEKIYYSGYNHAKVSRIEYHYDDNVVYIVIDSD